MKRSLLFMVLVIGVLGCRRVPVERALLEKGEAGEENAMPVVGFTSSGAVVIFDGRTGAITSSVSGGGGTPRDVAMDPWRKGVWVFEENEDASGGEIRFCPLEKAFGEAHDGLPTILGPCSHAVWVDGVAALYASKEGLWVFEDGIGGPRWKVLREGEVTAGTSAPRPASIWREGERIEALSYGVYDNRLVKYGGIFEKTAPLVQPEFDWGEPAGYPPTTRYARVSNDAGLLFDAVSGDLTVRRVEGGHMFPSTLLDVGRSVTRIEGAEVVGGSALVLATDTLWIVAVDEAGVEPMAGVWLEGDVFSSHLFFSRDMLVVPSRTFVGTDRGVRAIVLENDGAAVFNGFLDERFVGTGLRGPLDMIRASSL